MGRTLFPATALALAAAGFSALAISGCATAPELGTSSQDAWALFDSACAIGADVRTVTGSVWLKATSRDASGQFPAMVNARAPDSLTLEVTNLIGATQAVITVTGQKFVITAPDPSRPGGMSTQEGRDSWGGIPLRWATDLFVGRIPCPTSASVREGAALSIADSSLTVDARSTGERFVYHFRSWGGKPWPETLHWERAGVAVDFKFEDPEDPGGSPRRWEAKSSQGEVKARWRDRKTAS